MVTLAALFTLSPEEAIGAPVHESETTPAQKLAARPELEYKGVKNYNQPQGWGCVGYLRKRGYYVPMSPTKVAGGIVVDSTELPPEGEYVVIVTWEGDVGHVVLGTNINGQLIVRDEGNFGKGGGKGRVIPLELYKGYIATPRTT